MEKALDKLNRLDRKTVMILVFALFVISSVLRAALASYPKSLQIYPDEIRYIDISRSLFAGDGIKVHNVHMNFDQILYPLFILPFSFIKDQVLQVKAITVFNSVLISSVLFPVFLLGRRILRDNSTLLLLVLTVFVLPDLSMSATFMSENLFYPLSAWLIFFVFRFFESEEKKDGILYCVLCAFFCFLLYLVKVVAVYFIGAFLFALAFDCLFTKKNPVRQNIRYGILFCLVAGGTILGYKLLLFLLLGPGVSSYTGNRRLSVYDLNTFIYFFYANIYNGMLALTAFFYFPVVMPLIRFRRFCKSERNLLVFAAVSLIAMIVIITLSISLNEDYPKMYMRQHTRYYAPLLIPFLTLFFKELFAKGAYEEGDPPKKRAAVLIALTVFSCMIVLCVFRFFSNVCIDGVLLQTLSSLGEKYAKITGDPNEFHVTWQLMLAKGLLVLGAAAFTVLFLRERTRKAGSRVFVVLIVLVSVLNNFFAMKEFKRIYEKSPDQIGQAIAINQYLEKNGGNVLVITDGYNPVLDTYLTVPVYWTKKSEALKLIENREFIDLSEQKIISNYPSTPYEDLKEADYIITDNSVRVDEASHEEIELEGVTRFNIYKNSEKTKLYLTK